MPSSTQKDPKRSSKFNYLIPEDHKEKLSKYDKLNFSPKIYRRTYEPTIKQQDAQKQKENVSQNLSKCIKSNVKTYSKNVYQQQSTQKHGLISFGKNRNTEKSSVQEESSSNHFAQEEQSHKQSQELERKGSNYLRPRNKSIGSIGVKKPLFEVRDSVIENRLEFSPYQEELKGSQDDKTKFTRSRIEINPYISGLQSHGENLLIYELEEQQLIVRKQLKEYEYQNELLRQRVESLESENSSLRQLNQQHTIELQESELAYQRKLQSLSLDMKELEEQMAIWKIENEQLVAELNEEKSLIVEMEEELHLLASKNEELLIHSNSKDETIVELRTKLQLMQIDQLNAIDYEKNKRRKSLDLSTTQLRKAVALEEKMHHELSKLVQREQLQDTREYHTQMSKTSNIGKLLNKNHSHEESNIRFREYSNQNSINNSKIEPFKPTAFEKYINFIDSVRTMYLKVTGQESKDLKELWKWLKMVTHEYQSFVFLHGLKDSILAVVEDMENRLDTSKVQDQLSFMDKECYKIIKKLSNAVLKED